MQLHVAGIDRSKRSLLLQGGGGERSAGYCRAPIHAVGADKEVVLRNRPCRRTILPRQILETAQGVTLAQVHLDMVGIPRRVPPSIGVDLGHPERGGIVVDGIQGRTIERVRFFTIHAGYPPARFGQSKIVSGNLQHFDGIDLRVSDHPHKIDGQRAGGHADYRAFYQCSIPADRTENI